MIVGIGINLVSHPVIRGVATTDLASEGAPGVDRDLLLATLCRCLKDRVTVWERFGFASQRQAWLDRAAGIGARASFDGDTSLEGPDSRACGRRSADCGIGRPAHAGCVRYPAIAVRHAPVVWGNPGPSGVGSPRMKDLLLAIDAGNTNTVFCRVSEQ